MKDTTKRLKKFAFLGVLLLLASAGIAGCGSGDNSNDPISFTISPGTATVQRSATFQFITSPAGLDDVEWTVAGDANGTIDADGLYTAPSAIPIENVVTISAERDGITATATVTVIAANTLAFSSPQQISQTPLSNTNAIVSMIYQGTANGIGAGLGSVDVSSSWLGVTGSNADVMYSESTDLAPFLPEVNLTNNSDAAFNSLFLDQNLNPGIFYTAVTTDNLFFIGSSDQGSTFSAPVPVANPASGLFELAATGTTDGDNNYYVTYTEDLAGTAAVLLAESTDQGATWSTPVPVSPTLNDFSYSSVAVSEDASTLAVCYQESLAGNFEIFVSVSTDGGTTFPLQTNVSASDPLDEFFCSLALGPQGQIYVVFQQEDGGGSGDILFVSSVDGGASFTAPVTVLAPATGDQTLPQISVDSTGRIDVVWSDDNNSGGGFGIQVGYARSTDGGVTFTNSTIVPASAANIAVPRGLVHDESGRLHLQYLSDVNDPGNNVDFFYIYGQ